MNKIEGLKIRFKTDGFFVTLKTVLLNRINLRLDGWFQQICNKVYCHKPLADIIMIESHNDFDCNGGPFYDYLIENHYNEKYKIVWLLKNKDTRELPKNVYAYRLHRPSWRKSQYMATAKFLLYDNVPVYKRRPTQKSMYLTHGAFGLKDAHGVEAVGDIADYLISPSANMDELCAYSWSLPYPTDKLVHLGFPSDNVFYRNLPNEYDKFIHKKYHKILLWLPTFRQLKNNLQRVESEAEYPYGLPLITSQEDYTKLDSILKKNDILLVIKLHPMQDLHVIEELDETENIKWLDALSVKKLGLDTYRLMRFSDALLSDYSAVAYSYLHRNRPIGYVLSDLQDYKRGVCVDNPDDYMAGDKIFSMNDLYAFIDKLANNQDEYAQQRKALFDYMYAHHDDKSCERIVEFLGITK